MPQKVHIQEKYKALRHSQKSDSVNRCAFTWGTILPNFISIRFESTERTL